MMQKYKVYINNEVKIVEENWKDFCSKFIMVEAAGGLVFNKDGYILMIFRNGKWDLPKGKLEIGESVEECAIREVEEECGISGLIIENKIKDTYHTYNLNGSDILKKTYWFLMTTKSEQKLTPQTEEGITDVKWCSEKEVEDNLNNSYPNIIDVFNSL
jgi:8-oxo-dGTP pyrophosphatase MutT (NUDIX family)